MRFVCDACQDITNIEADRMEDGVLPGQMVLEGMEDI